MSIEPAEAETQVEGGLMVAMPACPRCGGQHGTMIFREFQRKPDLREVRLTHWAICPATAEPITRWEAK